MKFFERLLFGSDGVKRIEEAERRLEAARVERAKNIETVRKSLLDAVNNVKSITRSDPPIVKFVILEPDPEPVSRESRH